MVNRRNAKKTFRFSDLEKEHQIEIIGNLGRKVAEKTVWELIPDFPVDPDAKIFSRSSTPVTVGK